MQKKIAENCDRFDEALRAVVTPSNPDAYSIFTFVQQRLRQFNLYNDDPNGIFNEVYLRGRKLMKSGTEIRNPLGWIRATALNVIRERARDRKITTDSVHPSEIIVALYSSNPNEEDGNTDALNYTALKWALSQLSAEDLKILELRYGDRDLSWQEIGEHLGYVWMRPINTATVRQKGFRALKRLRKLFHSYLEDLNATETQKLSDSSEVTYPKSAHPKSPHSAPITCSTALKQYSG